MKIDLLAVDWSGTISDDFPIIVASANNILRIFGKPPINSERLSELYNADVVAAYRPLGINATSEELYEMNSRFLKAQPRPNPIPLAIEAICTASNLVGKLVIFSSHPSEEIEQDIKNWGLSGYIDAVYGGMRKNIDGDFERMLRETGAKRDATLYVGDATLDIDLAKRNLVKCAAVINPKYCYQNPEKVRSHFPQADFYLNEISALVPLIKNSA